MAEADVHGGPPATAPARAEAPRVRSGVQLLTAVARLAVVVGLGVAADPAAAGLARVSGDATTALGASASGAAVEPSGHTTRVRVEAHDMSYRPDSITVPYGDRLVIDLTNLDKGAPHDLTFGHGIQTGRVMPGRSATVDAGVVGASTQAWCRIIGHKQMGMVLDVVVAGGPEASSASGAVTAADDPRPSTVEVPVDLTGVTGPDFTAVPASLPPLDGTRTRAATLTIEEVDLEVAPGVRQRRWTFNGAVPGPTLHGRVGDTFVVTLVNHASMGTPSTSTPGTARRTTSCEPSRRARRSPTGSSLTGPGCGCTTARRCR